MPSLLNDSVECAEGRVHAQQSRICDIRASVCWFISIVVCIVGLICYLKYSFPRMFACRGIWALSSHS